ncbi:penicillin-binding protein 2 [Gordonibacter sp. 28C]|uniref:peptidoglycan D,D-transpeptidase FtsI family protein n=1 Tax=Gordonibacter sp. 28C TaxID=2078569 RepID=UPI000DF7A906|nr:penicillin-binding protein 2 [Gordonibacter sp. 28C]RDB60792.1 penicillin-binding protein 2 [Gordonibacter sp. 28C]
MAGRPHTPRGGRPSGAARSPRAAGDAFPAESGRAFIPIVLFAVIAALFLVRLVYLQVIVAPTYSAQAEEARTVGFDIEPRRGTIYDRNGTVLAVSVDATTIYANPSEVEDIRGTAAALAGALGGEAADYESTLAANNTTFAFIKRKADTAVADQVRALDLKGIYFISESRREYPNGRVGAQVIGLTDIDGEGLTGLEYYYDDILSGTAGRYEAERGRDGTPIPGGVHEETPAVDGEDIMISLDIELQQSVEDRLLADEKGLTSNGGSAVVMDGETGEIYAAASLPLLDPNDRENIKAGATELKTVTDLFEPGSIFKSVSAMAILETGSMAPDTTLFCPSEIVADGYTITDAHDRGDATYTLQEIMDQSSNIGISLATENMGFDKFYEHILKYNLHEKTGVDFPGEGEEGTDILGYMVPFDDLSKVTAYNMSFGQGISVTPMQMTRFYGALANDGVECTPHFLMSKPQTGETMEYATEKVIDSEKAISQMTDMLKTVVTDGTGKDAAIEGYNVAGKTSTAEIYDDVNGGYRKGVYNMAFTGFIADSTGPQLVCFVGANETEYGSIVTPVFKDIMSTAIDRFKISPK